jgi:hypothetical protein
VKQDEGKSKHSDACNIGLLWMSPCFPGSFGDSGCFDRCVQARELLGDHGPVNRLRFRITLPTQPAGQLLQAQGVPVDHEHVQYVTGTYVIGDAGFKCKQGMIVPFCGRNVANLSPEQAAFNTALSKQRMKVEHFHGMVKKRWRRLVYTGLDDADLVAFTLRVCIAILNFLVRKAFAKMQNDANRFQQTSSPWEDSIGRHGQQSGWRLGNLLNR